MEGRNRETQSVYKRFFRGEKAAIAELVETYRVGLILFLHGYVRDIDAAEDLASDTFARLLIKKPKLRDERRFKTYLFAMGKNAALSYLRKNKRLVRLDESRTAEEDFEWALIRDERRVAVARAIESIGGEYASVLLLRYYEELSVDDIANVMGKNKKQVYNLLQRAKERLRERLKKEGIAYETD